MRRVLIYPVLCLSLSAAAVGCSRERAASTSDPASGAPMADAASTDGKQVEVTGCLTSNAQTNQFVLTANKTALTSLTNRAGAGESETFHYQLVGGRDLASYLGREVVVKGAVKGDGDDVNIESKEKPAQPEMTDRGDKPTPAVETQEEVEMQVEQLQVASVTPTGAACQIGQGQDQRR